MKRKEFAVALLIVFLSRAGRADADRLTVLLSFDSAEIGPAVSFDGELRLSGGGEITLRPWMHDGRDAVDGPRFQLTSEHTAESAAAARLVKAYRSTLPKGLLVWKWKPPTRPC